MGAVADPEDRQPEAPGPGEQGPVEGELSGGDGLEGDLWRVGGVGFEVVAAREQKGVNGPGRAHGVGPGRQQDGVSPRLGDGFAVTPIEVDVFPARPPATPIIETGRDTDHESHGTSIGGWPCRAVLAFSCFKWLGH